jgi:hypothetical protein
MNNAELMQLCTRAAYGAVFKRNNGLSYAAYFHMSGFYVLIK